MATIYIRPATLADLPLIAAIDIAANHTHPVVSIPWPSPAAAQDVFLQRYTFFFNSPLYHIHVAGFPPLDSAAGEGEIIGFMSYKTPGGPDEEQWKPNRPEGTDMKFMSMLNETVEEGRKDLDFTGLWELDSLAVHPTQHRKGVGSALLKELVTELDKEKVGCWMSASKMGRPLYEKFGWKYWGEKTTDLSAWGREPYVNLFMKRDAKT